jgi:hypothetical protein
VAAGSGPGGVSLSCARSARSAGARASGYRVDGSSADPPIIRAAATDFTTMSGSGNSRDDRPMRRRRTAARGLDDRYSSHRPGPGEAPPVASVWSADALEQHRRQPARWGRRPSHREPARHPCDRRGCRNVAAGTVACSSRTGWRFQRRTPPGPGGRALGVARGSATTSQEIAPTPAEPHPTSNRCVVGPIRRVGGGAARVRQAEHQVERRRAGAALPYHSIGATWLIYAPWSTRTGTVNDRHREGRRLGRRYVGVVRLARS